MAKQKPQKKSQNKDSNNSYKTQQMNGGGGSDVAAAAAAISSYQQQQQDANATTIADTSSSSSSPSSDSREQQQQQQDSEHDDESITIDSGTGLDRESKDVMEELRNRTRALRKRVKRFSDLEKKLKDDVTFSVAKTSGGKSGKKSGKKNTGAAAAASTLSAAAPLTPGDKLRIQKTQYDEVQRQYLQSVDVIQKLREEVASVRASSVDENGITAQQQIEKLRRELDTKNGAISALESRVSVAEQHGRDRDQQLAQRDATIRNLQHTRSSARGRRSSMHSEPPASTHRHCKWQSTARNTNRCSRKWMR